MIARILAFICLVVVLLSCSSKELRQAPPNNSKFFRAGFPEVTLNTMGLININNQPSINVFIQINNESIFLLNDENGVKKGSITVEIQLLGASIGANGVFSKSFTLDLTEEIKKNPKDSYDIKNQFLVPPGYCKVNVSVTDDQSLKVSTVSAQTIIPDLNTENPTLTSLALLVKDQSTKEYEPFLSTAIPQRFDSIQFYAQIFPGKKNLQSLNLVISQYLSDTLPARRIFEQNILPGQIQYLGIKYDSETQLVSKNIPFEKDTSKILELSEFFQLPSIGNYRVELTSTFLDTLPLSQLYEFSVKPAYFPQIRTAKELAEPLIYLMDTKDHEKMMRIKNPDSLKRAVDLFWVKFIGDIKIAKQSLVLFYERVEYANRYFTTFKEGWKTDPGMMYILFGSPRLVDLQFRDVIWAYGMYQNNTNFDPEQTFLFNRIITQYSNFPYEHYILRRSPNYFQINYRVLDLWKNGMNLNR